MSTSKIEKDGITIFRSFLIGSNLIDFEINENDKSPSWDGFIIKYNDKKNKKENIEGRVPIQIKSENKNPQEKSNLYLSKIDLNNYLQDGGIIVIRPIYESLQKYKIFYSLLLPINILKIFNENKSTQQFYLIHLTETKTTKDFEAICSHFIKNQPLQRNTQNILTIENFLPKYNTIILRTLYRNNLPGSILSSECYIYGKLLDSLIVPLDAKISNIEYSRDTNVQIGNTQYFNKTIFYEDSNGKKITKFNEVIEFHINNGKLEFKINENGNLLFLEILQCMKFLKAIGEKGGFEIENQKIEFLEIKIPEEIYGNINFYLNCEKVFNFFNIEFNSITKKQIEQQFNLIDELIFIIENKECIEVENREFHFTANYILLNKPIILLFQNIKPKNFKVFNFFKTNPFDLDFQITFTNGTSYPCSRFLALETPELICGMLNYENDVLNDIKNYITYETEWLYQNFLLNSIHAYDMLTKPSIIDFCEKLNQVIKKNGSKPTRDQYPYYINKYQIIKRKRVLFKFEKRFLVFLKKYYIENAVVSVCINLLLGYKDQVDFEIRNLTEQKFTALSKWPIWKFNQ